MDLAASSLAIAMFLLSSTSSSSGREKGELALIILIIRKKRESTLVSSFEAPIDQTEKSGQCGPVEQATG